MSAPSTRRRVAANTLVQVLGKGLIAGAGALSIAVLTRYLGPTEYGQYSFALTYVSLFGVLADVGIFTTVVRDIAREPERTEELAGTALTLRAALTVVVILGATAIGHFLPYPHRVHVAILLAGVPLLFGALTSSFVVVPQAQLRMSRAVTADVSGRLVALGLALLVAGLDLGFYAVIGAAAGGALASFALTAHLTRNLARIRPRLDLPLARSILLAALPLGIALAVNEVYFRADTFIISLSRSFADVGNYTLAYRVLELTLIIGTVFLASTFPVLSAAMADDRARARRIIQSAFDALLLIGPPLVAGGLVLGTNVVSAAGGGRFVHAAAPLRVLMFAGALIWVNGVFGFALIAMDRQMSALRLNLAALGVNLVGNVLLVPRYGIVVAAAVTVLSELLILAGSYRLMRRHLGFFPRPRTLPAALGGAAVMAGVLLLVPGTAPVVVTIPLGALVYAGVLYLVSPASRSVVAGLRA